MISVCMYFQVHQPYRLSTYDFFDIGHNPYYLDEDKNAAICRKVADKSYLPANRLLLELINRYREDFQVSFSISGVAMEQFEKYTPEVLDSFKALADTGQVEFLAETYYHSLSGLYSQDEFRAQVRQQVETVRRHFGVTPVNFRNTELIYTNTIAWLASSLGFKSVLMEGADRILYGRSPNFIYQAKYNPEINVLLKNYKLSDDIAFRFSDRGWSEYPLLSQKYAWWLHNMAGNASNINLFMDYETFGEHQWADSGIFSFLRAMPLQVLKHPDFTFHTVNNSLSDRTPVGEIDTDHPVSWADMERDLSAWTGNSMQNEAIYAVYELEEQVLDSGNEALIDIWRKLQTSDHFYYMSTKYWSDGDVHKYFSPYNSPHEAYIYYMNVLQDLRQRLDALKVKKHTAHEQQKEAAPKAG